MEGILRCIFQLSVGNKLSLGPLSLLQENRANVCYAWDHSTICSSPSVVTLLCIKSSMRPSVTA